MTVLGGYGNVTWFLENCLLKLLFNKKKENI